MMSRSFKVGSLVIALLTIACGSLSQFNEKQCLKDGGAGCKCLANNTCESDALICVADVCQQPTCAPGQAGGNGCLCGEAGECAATLACISGRCVSDTGQTLLPPANAKCYTPCRGDLKRSDGLAACSADGLLEGCIGDAVCIAGSCQAEGGSASPTRASTVPVPLSCKVDSDCTDFQSCVAGGCYSDCNADTDCRGGRKCYRKACRVACQPSTTGQCPDATYCASTDGVSGFCLPAATGSVTNTVGTTTGTFDVTPTSFEFTSTKTSKIFVIQNKSAAQQRFTVRKLRHREFKNGAATLVSDAPLQWMTIGSDETSATKVQEFIVIVPANESRQFVLAAADNPQFARWEGAVSVISTALGTRNLSLSFSASLEGQWSGTTYFLSNFGVAGLDNWVAHKDSRPALSVVGNALIRRWGAFRDQRISLDEFKAVLTATQTQSWRWPQVQARCPNSDSPNPNVGCYLYNNGLGISIYSDYLPDNPIPSGVSEFPLVLNIHKSAASPSPLVWDGKISSDAALQYAGEPAIDVSFTSDPSGCGFKVGDACVSFLDKFDADIVVGGRYLTTSLDTTCSYTLADTFENTSVPWLVPGFELGTSLDLLTGARHRYECRDKTLPFGATPQRADLNASLASANPVPDGASRRRHIELIDGAVIDRQTMFVLFKERFPSFLDPTDTEGFAAYGYMLLNRQPARLQESDYEGSHVTDFRPPPALPEEACTPELLTKLLGSSAAVLSSTTADTVGVGVVAGVIPSALPPPVITPAHVEKVHYYCEDTGMFDGGPLDNGTPAGVRVSCPAQSKVQYFTVQGVTQAQIAGLGCQSGGVCRAGEPCSHDSACTVGAPCSKKGACGAVLQNWVANNSGQIRLDPVFRCTDPDEVFCSADRNDLRADKTFYGAEVATAIMPALDEAIAQSFRYKTRFRNRDGSSIGFAPETCVADGSVPYCYDPAGIENIRERVDCAVHVYTKYYPQLAAETRSVLKDFLVRNFSYSEQFVFGAPAPLIIDGFERLYSELLIMMGDESYTASFIARFDLAGQKLASFEGSKFEPGGIDLSGGVGFEMYRLYQATQYYQLSLDRFYRQLGAIWSSLASLPPGQGFITQATTTSYFDRLIRASSQKARAWSEISKRYLSFNRPDLARLVVGRAYTSAYLEAVILSRIMSRVVDVSSPTATAQIQKQIEDAALTYRVALLDMRNVYQSISDQTTQFGFPLGYIPFPALDSPDTNAFSQVLASANEKLEAARIKEQRALTDNRAFETDAASFQSELASLSGSYEDQLSEICGTFTVSDNGETKVYAAIPKYAFLDGRARLFGDPCGLMGSGGLHDQFVALELSRLDFASLQLSYANLMGRVADVEAQTAEQCGRVRAFADLQFENENKKLSFQDGIASLQLINDTASNVISVVEKNTDFIKCTAGLATDCPQAAVAAGTYNAVAITLYALQAVNNGIIVGLERKIGDIEASQLKDEILQECAAAEIDKKYAIKDLMREAAELELEFVKQEYAIKLVLSQILKLRNDATSLMASQTDSEQLRINVEAARNDPNVRIYRNDAVYAAERTFEAARKEAFKATRVYEYYTSQSYPALDKLFLVRMVESGDITLESYIAELSEAFERFQEQFGNPDKRVAIVSLRDDILGIPRLDASGRALSEAERTTLFRTKLADTSLLDNRGYITFPFSTSLDQLSPLTANHKVLYVQAEIVGQDVGDKLGRLYLTQNGTGTVRRVDGEKNYFAFDPRTAVINTFFNGQKQLDDAIYSNARLRDLPVVNTGWSLIFNRKDELVNKDVQLGSLNDVRLYLYYSDFTSL